MPAKKISRCRFSGFARIMIAPTCATTSVRIVGGSAGRPSTDGRQVPLVVGDVLDPDDPLVDLELRDPIDEQKRITVEQDLLDRGIVERQRQVHVRSDYTAEATSRFSARRLRTQS